MFTGRPLLLFLKVVSRFLHDFDVHFDTHLGHFCACSGDLLVLLDFGLADGAYICVFGRCENLI